MAKIHFDIKYRDKIESGEYKVILDCGVEAEILAWDKPGEYPIVCMAEKEGAIPFRTNNNGKAYHFPEGANYSDLFIVTPEEELTDFENAFGRAMMEIPEPKEKEEWYPFLKEKATELLALAREQLIKEGYVIEKKTFHDAVERIGPEVMKEVSEDIDFSNFIHELGERYPEVSFAKLKLIAKAAYDFGKARVLKDLPRWRKASGKERFSERMIVLAGDNDLYCTNYAEEGEYYLPFPILEKLPKEDSNE